MNFNNIKTVMFRIFKQIKRDRRTLGLMIVGPIFVTILFSYAFSGELKNVPITIANQDQPFKEMIASSIVEQMQENDSFNIIERKDTSINWSDFGIGTQAIVLFPQNFTRGLLTGENITLNIWINVSTQYYAWIISNFVSNTVSDVLEDYFGNMMLSFKFNTTYLQSIPVYGEMPKFNITVINLDQGFNIVFGDKIIEALKQDDSVSISMGNDKEDCINSVSMKKSVVGFWIPSNFTRSLLLRNDTIAEIFVNGIEKDDAIVALKSIQEAVANVVSDILNVSFYNLTKNYIYGAEDMQIIDIIGPSVMGFISMFFAFILSGVFFLRERLLGTLERMLATPLSKTEIIFGYLFSFMLIVTVQSALVVLTVMAVTMTLIPNLLFVYLLVLLCAIGSVSLALFFASFMKTELQVIQMIPIYIVPQVFLCGMFVPIRALPDFLIPVAYIFPLTYYTEAAKAVAFMNASLIDIWIDFLVLVLYFALGLILSLIGFKKTIE
ncbi:MAG: ABC transporter permease [Candidatus Odinarchaeota archaeon]|nr:ABC transporter permease [Candidatus Odinarchaeota archaeon]